MTLRGRRFLSIVLIIVIIAGIGIGTYFLFFNSKDQALRVRRITAQEIVDHKIADFNSSRLRIFPYGAFEIELIRTIGDESEIFFVGNGQYTKAKNMYTFIYADSYYRVGALLEQRKDYSQDCPIESNGRVRFDTPWGISYYFGK